LAEVAGAVFSAAEGFCGAFLVALGLLFAGAIWAEAGPAARQTAAARRSERTMRILSGDAIIRVPPMG
jgi:hypothetical protein